MKQGLGLGKGIGALIPKELIRQDTTAQQSIADVSDDATGVAQIEIDRISMNPVQPRHHFDQGALEELARSIAVHGVITPITVRKHFDGYELIAGERRLRASKMAGRTVIPAYVMDVGSDGQMLEIAIVENVQREDLNPLEVALGYQRLIDECSLTQEEVAVKVGKDRSTVANFLRLLRLPLDIQTSVRTKRISMGHARALLALTSEHAQLTVLREIIKRDLPVRKTEALVKDIELGHKIIGKGGAIEDVTEVPVSRKTKSSQPSSGSEANSLKDIENSLRHIFATQVRVSVKPDESGSIDISFYSLEELERLLDLMLSVHGETKK